MRHVPISVHGSTKKTSFQLPDLAGRLEPPVQVCQVQGHQGCQVGMIVFLLDVFLN